MMRFSMVFGLILFGFSWIQSQEKSDTSIDKYLKISNDFVNSDLDSAQFYRDKAAKLLSETSDDSIHIKFLNASGKILLVRGDYANSLENHYQAKKRVETFLLKHPKNQQYLKLKVETFSHLGANYLIQNKYEDALSYFNDAMAVLEENKLKNAQEELKYKIQLLNNTAAIFTKKGEFDKALGYYLPARELAAEMNNRTVEASLINNIGICYMENKNFQLSASYFEEALEIRKSLKDSRGIAQCYNNLGKNYALQGKYETAEPYFLEALKIGRSIGSSQSILHSLESLTALYNKKNDFKNAYAMHVEMTNMKDSLFNEETVKRIAQIELNHKLEKQKELYELNLEKKDVERQKANLIYFSLGGVLVLFLLIAGLLLYLQKVKIKNIKLSSEKLELKHINTRLENEKLAEDLAFKNRELTTKVMYLHKKNELINSISEKLIELKKESKLSNQKVIQDLVIELRSGRDVDIWNEFETHFTSVHPEFYQKLYQLYPDLTPNEKKLCAFLKLNMSTKDISAITYQTLNSITVSRTRLRKKLNISGEDVHLSNFLENL